MSHKVDSLRQKLGDITDECRVILSDAERSGRALTPVEQSDIARLKAQFDDIEAQISAADLDERASRALPQKTSPTPVGSWNGTRPGPVSSWGKAARAGSTPSASSSASIKYAAERQHRRAADERGNDLRR